jgi:hypothetical protein
MLISMFQNAEYPKDKSKKVVQQTILDQWFPRSKAQGNFSVTFTNDSDIMLVHRILSAAQGNIDLLGALPMHLKRFSDPDDAWPKHLSAITMWFVCVISFLFFSWKFSNPDHSWHSRCRCFRCHDTMRREPWFFRHSS